MKFVVSAVFVTETGNVKTETHSMSKIEAISEEEAVGIFLRDSMNASHTIKGKPLVVDI